MFDAITGMLLSTAGSLLTNELIGKSNARSANANSALAATTAYQREKYLMDYQKDLNEDMYSSRYQNMVNDLRAAGLNPILAASGGFSTSGTPSVQLGSAPMGQTFQAPNPIVDSGTTAKNIAETEKTKEETINKRKERLLLIEQAKQTAAKTKETMQNIHNLRAREKLTTQEEKVAIQKMFNLEQEFLLGARKIEETLARIEQIQSTTDLQQSERLLLEDKSKEVKQNIRNLKVIQSKVIQETEKLKKIAGVYSSPAGKILAYMQEILKSLPMAYIVGGMRK